MRFPNNYNQKQIAKIFEKGKAKNIQIKLEFILYYF